MLASVDDELAVSVHQVFDFAVVVTVLAESDIVDLTSHGVTDLVDVLGVEVLSG